ncbi:ABC transporter substrate-binding protein [Petrotoga halophila]|uniref:ABC transporter substrate-binding protein n=1 Tax=Petrotoga halophila TaxID=301141 RepID=UPI000CDE7BE0|nr:sugar ABC transporter substrate-binding protein [Petrotoga halophila]
MKKGILIFLTLFTMIIGLGQTSDLAGTEIYVAIRSLPETDFIMSKVSEFTQQTGIKVRFVLYPELQLREKVVMDFVSNVGAYDVIALDSVYVEEFVQKGWLLPLDSYLKEETNIDDFFQKVLQMFIREGKVYGLPVYSEITHLMYRKDIFQEKGIKVPQTFEELEKVASQLNNPPEMYGIAMRGLRGDGMNVYTWTTFLRGFGGKYFDDSWNPVFNNEEGVKSLEYYTNLLTKYGPPGVATYSWDDVQSAFTSGSVSMIIDANNFMTRIEDPEKSQIVGKIGYAPVPSGPAGIFPGIYSMGFGVSAIGAKTEKEKLAAAEFVQWATSSEMQLEMALQTGVVSANRSSVFDNPVFQAKYSDDIYPGWLSSTLLSYDLAMPDFRPLIPEWREVGNTVGIAIEQALSGALTPKKALDQAAKECERILRASGKIK